MSPLNAATDKWCVAPRRCTPTPGSEDCIAAFIHIVPTSDMLAVAFPLADTVAIAPYWRGKNRRRPFEVFLTNMGHGTQTFNLGQR